MEKIPKIVDYFILRKLFSRRGMETFIVIGLEAGGLWGKMMEIKIKMNMRIAKGLDGVLARKKR
jgi:hypothetical protein